MSENRCVCCDEIIPEGNQACWSCEHSVEHHSNIPSDKQIRIADLIAEILEIDFPQSSEEFTEEIYADFISNHLDEALKVAYCIDNKNE